MSGRAKNIPERDTLLLPFQAKWVLDPARLKLAEKSRQIGWSWATAYSIVRKKSVADARLDAWISSRDDIQARLFLEDCKGFASLLQTAADDLGERVVDADGHTAYTLKFANGLRAHSMSSNPDAQAGKRGDRVLDEFALHPDPRKLYSIAYPGITWGGALEIFSTHRGSANYFNELIREIKERGNPKNFSYHRVTLQDALDQGFLYKLQQKLPPDDPRQEMDEADYFNFVRAGAADEESFQQEYMCVPADDAAAFMSYDLIASCEYKSDQFGEFKIMRAEGASPFQEIGTFDLRNAKNPLYVGVDVGRTKDLTAIWVDEKIGDTAFTRLLIEMRNKTFDAQEYELYRVLEHPLVRRACIDNTGIGRQFAERAQKRFRQYRVEPITFTGPVKEELAYPVRSGFEDRTERIPQDKLIRSDFRSIKKETTASGNIRFTADAGPGGHADRFWAKALAKHAGKTVGAAFGFDDVTDVPMSSRTAGFEPFAEEHWERTSVLL